MPAIFDSHAHYDSQAFAEDRDQVLDRLFRSGDAGEGYPAIPVCGIVNAGSDISSSRTGIALAERYDRIWCGAGIHPEEAAAAAEEDIASLRELAGHPRVVAIGEIGLDYHYEELCPRDTQQKWFRRQLELARELQLPVIVHDREAHEDTMRLLTEFCRPQSGAGADGGTPVSGVIHCFTGSVEMAREVIKLGLYIGLGGVVTFKNARKAVEVAGEIPLDRLLLETDAPYMAPAPFRGKRCHSGLIAHVAARIGEIRGIPMEQVLNAARENACRLFRITLPE